MASEALVLVDDEKGWDMADNNTFTSAAVSMVLDDTAAASSNTLFMAASMMTGRNNRNTCTRRGGAVEAITSIFSSKEVSVCKVASSPLSLLSNTKMDVVVCPLLVDSKLINISPI